MRPAQSFLPLILLSLLFLADATLAAEECSFSMEAKNTRDFINEIPIANGKLQDCPVKLRTGTGLLIRNGEVGAEIRMDDPATESFSLSIRKGHLVSFSRPAGEPKLTLETDEASFDALLQADDQFSSFSQLYKEKKILLKGNTFFQKLKLLFTKPLLWLATRFAG